MDFPAAPARWCETSAALVEALGTEPIWVGRNRFDLLVELSSEQAVRELTPDVRRLRSMGPHWSDRLGRAELIGLQASERGGVVRVLSRGDRVTLSGQAVTTMRGELI